MTFFLRVSPVRTLLVAAAALLGASSLLTGCAAGPAATTITPDTGTAHIGGRLMGGQQPVGGSTVELWQTAASGYGTGATKLLTTTTLQDGTFTFNPPLNTGNCNSGAYAYVAATGGDPTGTSTSNLNPKIKMVAAIGLCTSIESSTTVNINELTTVAAAYALRAFATDSTTSSAAGNILIGTSSTNTQGLADAFATAAKLVNTSNGVANPSTEYVLLPSTTVNTLGNIMAACVNATTDMTNCNTLLAAATPPVASPTAPADVFQAFLNIAKYPGANVPALLALAPAVAPFAPTLTGSSGSSSALNDLSLAIAFVNPALLGASTANAYALGIDKSDNIIVMGSTDSAGAKPRYFTELTSGSAGYTATTSSYMTGTSNITPQTLVVDTNNNVWASNSSQGAIIKIPNETSASASSILLTSPDGLLASSSSADVAQNTWAIGMDGSGNLFTSSYRSVTNCASSGTTKNTLCLVEELANGGSAFTYQFGPSNTVDYVSSSRGMSVDATNGNVWSTSYNTGSNTVQVLTPSTGAVVSTTTGPSGAAPLGIAIDGSSNAWVTTYTNPGLYEIAAGGASAGVAATAYSPSVIPSTTSAPANNATATVPFGGWYQPRYLAVDGAGNIFASNSSQGTIVQYTPTFNDGKNGSTAGAYLSPYYGFSPSLPSEQTATISKVVIASNVATFTSTNTFTAGQQVTLDGFYTLNYLNGQTVTITAATGSNFTAAFTHANISTSDDGVALGTVNAANQTLFTCSGTTTITCAAAGTPYNSAYPISIDRAGAVWTSNANGNLIEMLGPGAPTNPVLSSVGQYGVQP